MEVVAVGAAEFFDGGFDEGVDVFVACVGSGVGGVGHDAELLPGFDVGGGFPVVLVVDGLFAYCAGSGHVAVLDGEGVEGGVYVVFVEVVEDSPPGVVHNFLVVWIYLMVPGGVDSIDNLNELFLSQGTLLSYLDCQRTLRNAQYVRSPARSVRCSYIFCRSDYVPYARVIVSSPGLLVQQRVHRIRGRLW